MRCWNLNSVQIGETGLSVAESAIERGRWRLTRAARGLLPISKESEGERQLAWDFLIMLIEFVL